MPGLAFTGKVDYSVGSRHRHCALIVPVIWIMGDITKETVLTQPITKKEGATDSYKMTN